MDIQRGQAPETRSCRVSRKPYVEDQSETSPFAKSVCDSNAEITWWIRRHGTASTRDISIELVDLFEVQVLFISEVG